MTLLVEWSPRSKLEYFYLLNYLKENLGKEKVDESMISIAKIILRIADMPLMFPPISKSKTKIRYAVLTKHTTIIYKISRKKIEIASLFDTRQNPTKRKI